jgi:hypothetical protein
MIGTAIMIAMITDSWQSQGRRKCLPFSISILSLKTCAAILLDVFICFNARRARTHNMNVESLGAD